MFTVVEAFLVCMNDLQNRNRRLRDHLIRLDQTVSSQDLALGRQAETIRQLHAERAALRLKVAEAQSPTRQCSLFDAATR